MYWWEPGTVKGFAQKFYEITLELSILTLNCYFESQGLNLDVWGGNNFQAIKQTEASYICNLPTI